MNHKKELLGGLWPMGNRLHRGCGSGYGLQLKEATGGEFRVCRASIMLL